MGARKADIPTLFFMPHCKIDLYNNMLLANYNNADNDGTAEKGDSCSLLESIVLIGNTLSIYPLRFSSKSMKSKYSGVNSIIEQGFIEIEEKLPTYESNFESFNDTSIHTFSFNKI
jgi:hypothetical protein